MTLSKTKTGVLNDFETRTDAWSCGEFERALERAMGKRYGNYQTAKAVIQEADETGGWPRTVEHYVRANHAAFGTVPLEFAAIAARLQLGP